MKSAEKLIAKLNGLNGCTGVSIVYRTEVDHNVKSRLNKDLKWSDAFGAKEVIKRQVINSNIGANYTNAVNNQQVREGAVEGTFVADSLPYGKWIVPNILLDNGKGELQIRVYKDMGICSKNDDADYFWSTGETVTPVEMELVNQFITPKKESASDTQGVDKVVKPRNLNIARIESIKIMGEVIK